jgi:formylglycine-generating enzyme required for sulfatase activity
MRRVHDAMKPAFGCRSRRALRTCPLVLCLLLLTTGCSAPTAGTAATALAAEPIANPTSGPQPPAGLSLEIPGAPPIELIPIAGHCLIAPFLLARTELTYAQFAPFLHATGYNGSEHPSSKGSEPFLADWHGATTPPPDRATYPVCYLNVHHARAFCDWATRTTGRRVRLPSDAEWELAARGPERRTFPWGMEWDPTRCNSAGAEDGFAEAAPVGSFANGATPEGVFDLAGNIWEWTAEGHLRGGPWCLGAHVMESAVIAREDPERADDKFGFRVVVEP